MNSQLIVGIIILFILFYYAFKKDNFYNIQKDLQEDYDLYYRPTFYSNQVVPAEKNQTITKTEIASLLRELITYTNGAPGGANVNVNQSKYDLIFKDVLVSSDKRNTAVYPNPNNYSVNLNIKLDKIYKAELIDVYVPSATDDSVNITPYGNRLYFTYIVALLPPTKITGYVAIQAGTYLSPDSIAKELTRQFGIILTGNGITPGVTVGISVVYDKNLNRYIIRDRQVYNPLEPTLFIYAKNGYVIPASAWSASYTVTDSIAPYILLFGDTYTAGPENIDIDQYQNLYVATGVPGDYGSYNGNDVPTNADCLFGNCIVSEVVLTHCKIYLSLGDKLNGDTCNITPNENDQSTGNVPRVFCQIPNNTCVSSSSVKTLLNQPHNFSAIQYYNPPISKINKFDISWFTEDGSLVRILDHCFTLRIYYFQKRIGTTDFSYPIP
jgi:hypothetical protein